MSQIEIRTRDGQKLGVIDEINDTVEVSEEWKKRRKKKRADAEKEEDSHE